MARAPRAPASAGRARNRRRGSEEALPRMQPPGRRESALREPGAPERPARARPRRRGSPDPIPNSEVKPAIAESTAAPGCGRVGRRARGGRFASRREAPERGLFLCSLFQFFAWSLRGLFFIWSAFGFLCYFAFPDGDVIRPHGAALSACLSHEKTVSPPWYLSARGYND